jgi:hypothetical protein
MAPSQSRGSKSLTYFTEIMVTDRSCMVDQSEFDSAYYPSSSLGYHSFSLFCKFLKVKKKTKEGSKWNTGNGLYITMNGRLLYKH